MSDKISYINDTKEVDILQDFILKNGLSINDVLGCVCMKLNKLNKEYDKYLSVNGVKYEIKIKEV